MQGRFFQIETGFACFDCFNCVRLCPEDAIDSRLTAEAIERHIGQLKKKSQTPNHKIWSLFASWRRAGNEEYRLWPGNCSDKKALKAFSRKPGTWPVFRAEPGLRSAFLILFAAGEIMIESRQRFDREVDYVKVSRHEEGQQKEAGKDPEGKAQGKAGKKEGKLSGSFD
ncbi:MAG: hypothetical protein K9K88_06355 [Desulfobacterales bacterium]|nr:hypothetical protein [Desulfobacterales bacterium]